MRITAAVAGASGSVGGELLRLICGHPLLELGPLTAEANAGVPVTDVHPDLARLAGRVFEPSDPERLASADLVFLALPVGGSARTVPGLPDSLRVVDVANDFRLADPAAWTRYYGTPHAGTWCYGLPELPGRRSLVTAGNRVASPGCYATASILGLAPLVTAGLAEPSDIVITAALGTSGVGRAGGSGPRASEVLDALRAYRVGGEHGTVPEVEQELTALAGTPATVSFTPMLAPMPRGILAICSIRLSGGATTGELRAALAAAYTDEPFVRLLPEGRWPSTGAVAGSNAAHLQVASDPRAGRAVVLVAIDNLGKGGAGQALQNANLMLGLPEEAGLTTGGVAP
ncbi:MAG TPA: N-acetyl-gamma-glutamyl-phosphate reductase [Candidatus Dormibacteraeota bacterium]|nr:N-acetyl-gamma-glutamyl-phosphate reductase [Candidatus Dormibacteraeota bacterium]